MITIIDDLSFYTAEQAGVDQRRQQTVRQRLADMQAHIISEGDKAVCHYLSRYDKVDMSSADLRVSEEEIKSAYTLCDDAFVQAIRAAAKNIRDFHEKQRPSSWTDVDETGGVSRGMTFTAIDAVGLYVPGGRALYPSTVLMNAIPASIAGVDRTVMLTPPRADGQIAPELRVAADICGVHEIYKVGGAQAVFAAAHGTESIAAVSKIVGPGNIYVDTAKQMVYGLVDIDKPAGPSEVLVYIQDPAYARYAASECLAQLEHDPDARAICISESRDVLIAVQDAFSTLFSRCKRQDIIRASLSNARLLVTATVDDSIAAINDIASEHLVLLVDRYQPLLDRIRNAGAVFCGPYTPVALGDYYAGPNHVLPTGGAAKFSSPLSVLDYMKSSTVLSYDKSALTKTKDHMNILTHTEGLDAHYLSVSVRLSGS